MINERLKTGDQISFVLTKGTPPFDALAVGFRYRIKTNTGAFAGVVTSKNETGVELRQIDDSLKWIPKNDIMSTEAA